ncbi:MAG: AI-2E family transporter [Candidatus Limnocylindrales bacterium]
MRSQPPLHAVRRPNRPSPRSDFEVWFRRGAGATLGAVVVVLIATGLVAAGRAVLLVFIALLLGAALEPLVGSLRGRLGLPRVVAILLVYVTFIALAAGLVLLVVPGTLAQADQLGAALPTALQNARQWASSLTPRAVGSAIVGLVDTAQNALSGNRGVPAAEILAAGLSVADAFVSFATVLALVFFWMTERARLQRFALSYLPADRRAGVREAWNGVETRLGSWVRGQLVLMGAMGVMVGVVCAVLGLPSPVLLGLLAGLAEAIPLVGPALGAAPALLVAATLKPDALPFVFVAYLVIHAIEGNVLAPLVVGNAAGISPFLVIASLLAGGAMGGLVGAFIAVPVAASLEVVLERLQDRDQPVTPAMEAVEPEEARPSHEDARGTSPVTGRPRH